MQNVNLISIAYIILSELFTEVKFAVYSKYILNSKIFYLQIKLKEIVIQVSL